MIVATWQGVSGVAAPCRVGLSAAAQAPGPSAAALQRAEGLQEVMVTAQKRENSRSGWTIASPTRFTHIAACWRPSSFTA